MVAEVHRRNHDWTGRVAVGMFETIGTWSVGVGADDRTLDRNNGFDHTHVGYVLPHSTR